jgi:hypothetical protein
MTKTNTTTNNKIRVIEINCIGFIVPNGSRKVGGDELNSFKTAMRRSLTATTLMVARGSLDIAEDTLAVCIEEGMNHKTNSTENVDCVQIWMHNEADLCSDNLFCHGFEHDGWCCGLDGNERVPAIYFEDCKEGDVATFMMPGWIRRPGQGNRHNEGVFFKINMTCEQFGKRYSSFGPFEKCLKRQLQD